MLSDEPLWAQLESVSGELVIEQLGRYQPLIKDLSEEFRAYFAKIRRSAKDLEAAPLKLPDRIVSAAGARRWPKHLYVDEGGLFPARFSGWESDFLEHRLANDDVLAWLRNPPRKEWSFSVVYDDERAEKVNMYPDFLVLRRLRNGLVVDLVEPHRADEGDAARKMVGLAAYADRHGASFGRIEMVSRGTDGVFRSLDLNDEKGRSAAKLVTTTSSVVKAFQDLGVPFSPGR
jgi:type III restriction enzyme